MTGQERGDHRRRIAASGLGRRVLDHIDTQERRTRAERTLTLSLAPWIIALLRYQHPMTEAEWAQMMQLLEVMKPGIVR